jgi:hypothetical protein
MDNKQHNTTAHDSIYCLYDGLHDQASFMNREAEPVFNDYTSSSICYFLFQIQTISNTINVENSIC